MCVYSDMLHKGMVGTANAWAAAADPQEKAKAEDVMVRDRHCPLRCMLRVVPCLVAADASTTANRPRSARSRPLKEFVTTRTSPTSLRTRRFMYLLRLILVHNSKATFKEIPAIFLAPLARETAGGLNFSRIETVFV